MKTTTGLLMMAAVSLILTGCQSHMEIVAHRGASYLAPENTVASAKLAWEKRADAVEGDVYLTRDGQIVVIHDSTTKRTTGGARDWKVAEHTSAELRQLDVGSFKSPAYAGERIPLLSELIATVPAHKQLFVELKCGPEVLAPLEQVLTTSGKRDRIVIIGFDLDTVKAAKKLMPDIPTYWLVGTKKDKETDEWIPYSPTLVDELAGTGLDGLDVHWAGVTKEFAESVKKAGLGLQVWTVDDPAEAACLAALGVQGITTNRPGWLREQLKHARKTGK